MNVSDRRRLLWWLLPAVLLIAGVVLAVAGWWVAASVCATAGVLSTLAVERMARPLPSTTSDISDDTAAEIRAERDRAGDIHAIRQLRTRHPGLHLTEATRFVRAL